jgi:hypothetical protein
MFRSGIMGWLAAVVVLIVIAIVPLAVVWCLMRFVRWVWRQLWATGAGPRAGARSSVEFYRRFEQIMGRMGMQRKDGQTPREFARAVGARLAATRGRRELYVRALQVAEAFYHVRFGQRKLGDSAAQAIERALKELTET